MKKRLIIFLTIIILVSVLVTASISAYFSLENHMNVKSRTLKAYSQMIASVIANDTDHEMLEKINEDAGILSQDTEYRVTIIDSDGNVLADSEAKENYVNLENHGSREEVKEALADGSGSSRRESESFGKEYLYFSSLAETDGGKIVVRVAMEINKWDIASRQVIRSSIFAAIIGIILAIIISLVYANKLMQPVREMENQLQVALDESEKAENIRKEFVANVTHELKTPLTSISGFVETMQEDPDLDSQTRLKFLDIIALESTRLARLIDDILIISDIESGRETNTDKDINIKQAIDEVIQTLLPVAESKNIKIDFEYQYEMYIGGNYDRFKQMMLNIIENAIKYSDSGTTVTVSCEKKVDVNSDTGDETSNVYIQISDQGIGVAEDKVDRLFERFYRVDKSRSQKAGGTGLGLAIVKHIATLFGARIQVKSTLGEGTEFTLIFPC